jgi:uncharacterized damage-inducible protein DinB
VTSEDVDRLEPPMQGDELSTLLGFLDWHRSTLEWKCGGLTDDDLRRTVGASSLTLGGLIKHMALVEETWFAYRLLGRPQGEPWSTADWDTDPDWELTSAAEDSAAALFALWRRCVAVARSATAEALDDGGLDRVCSRPLDDGRATPTLRWVLVHMIEEYARHNGHADLLRESIDGQTGD